MENLGIGGCTGEVLGDVEVAVAVAAAMAMLVVVNVCAILAGIGGVIQGGVHVVTVIQGEVRLSGRLIRGSCVGRGRRAGGGGHGRMIEYDCARCEQRTGDMSGGQGRNVAGEKTRFGEEEGKIRGRRMEKGREVRK